MSYRTMKNMDSGNVEEEHEPSCNCQPSKKAQCPLPGQCHLTSMAESSLLSTEHRSQDKTPELQKLTPNWRVDLLRLVSTHTTTTSGTTTLMMGPMLHPSCLQPSLLVLSAVPTRETFHHVWVSWKHSKHLLKKRNRIDHMNWPVCIQTI